MLFSIVSNVISVSSVTCNQCLRCQVSGHKISKRSRKFTTIRNISFPMYFRIKKNIQMYTHWQEKNTKVMYWNQVCTLHVAPSWHAAEDGLAVFSTVGGLTTRLGASWDLRTQIDIKGGFSRGSDNGDGVLRHGGRGFEARRYGTL